MTKNRDFNCLPYGQAKDWRIAFVDVETTGLIPGHHEMVDIGVVICDLSGEEIACFFQRIMPRYPGRASEEALSCNGFTVERWRETGAVSGEKAVEEIIEFYNSIVPEVHILMSAYNATFDHAFLDHLFRQAGKKARQLHNYVLDLPAVAWGAGYHNLHLNQIVERLGVEDEPRVSNGAKAWEHTGLTGAKLNKRIYQKLKAQEGIGGE